MKFTKRSIEAIQAKDSRQVFFDTEYPGLALRVSEAGRKTFYYTYRTGKGRRAEKKWVMLGAFPVMSVEQARDVAKQKGALILEGIDPAQEVKEGKEARKMREALQLFQDEYASKLKPQTKKLYAGIIAARVNPKLGNLLVKDIAYSHIAKLHHGMKGTPYLANRAVAMLSKFFNWCELHGYRERNTNPVSGLSKYPEEKRLRFMGKEELEALGKGFFSLEAEKGIDPVIAAALKMMLFTGARCMEILTLKWTYIDRDAGIASLPDSKTGAKIIHLPPQAFAVLETLPRMSEYCFPGRYGKGHIINVKDTWKRLLEASGLEGWRIHDMRHAFASVAASSGKSLPIIGKMLGHTQAATTNRYAHLSENPVAVAASETAAQLQKALSGGKVLPFKKAGNDA